MDLSPQSIENSKKKKQNWSVDNFKKYMISVSCTPEPEIQSHDTGQLTHFWQLSIAYNMDVQYQSYVYTDSVCLGLPASKWAISHPLTWTGGRTHEPKFLR